MLKRSHRPYWNLLAAAISIAVVTRLFTFKQMVPLEVINPRLMIQTGDAAKFLAFSPDGRHLVTASSDRAQVRDLSGGTVRANLEGHQGPIRGLAVDEGLAMTGSEDGTVRLWDLAAAVPVRVFTPHRDITAVALRKGVAAFGTRDGEVEVWSTEGEKLQSWREHLGLVTALAFHPQDGRLASAGQDGTVKLHSLPDGRLTANFKLYREEVTALAFRPDGLLAAGGSETIKIWNVDTGRVHDTLNPGEAVRSLGFGPDNLLLWADYGGQAEVRRLTSHQRLFEIKDSTGGAAISPAGGTLAVASGHDVDLYDLRTGRVTGAVRGQPRMRSVQFAADGGTLVAAAEGSVHLWDLQSGQPTTLALADIKGSLGVRPDGLEAAVPTGSSRVSLVNLHEPDQMREIDLGYGPISSTQYSSDGKFLIVETALDVRVFAEEKPLPFRLTRTEFQPSASLGKARLVDTVNGLKVKWVDLKTGKHTAVSIQNAVTSAAVSPDDRFLAFIHLLPGSAPRLQLRSLPEGKQLLNVDSSSDSVSGWKCQFSPDGGWLAARLGGETVVVDRVHLREAFRLPAAEFQFSPDSKCLAVFDGGVLSLRDLATQKQKVVDGQFGGLLQSLSFSPDGRVLAAANPWWTKLYDLRKNRQIATLLVLQPGDEWVVVTPEGLFDGTDEALRRMVWRMGTQTYSLSQFAEVYQVNSLLPRLLAGEALRPRPLVLHPPPIVRIVTPIHEQIVTQSMLEVAVLAEDQGGGVGPIHLKVDGVPMGAGKHRGNKQIFQLSLPSGRHRLQATATDLAGTMHATGDDIMVVRP